jgi:serine/threonine-protein kinase
VAAIDIKRIRSTPTQNVGDIIGNRYQIRGLLGQGGMARVFLALDRATSLPVALKVLDLKHLKEPRARARFILEAKAVAKAVHPNIVKVLDVGLHTDGGPFLVMEFLFGESLGEWLRRNRVMSPEIGIPFATQIASGIAAAHREGIIHRDVKPDNIFLIGEKGHPHEIKLVDFGLAKLAEHPGMTQAGVAVGTVEYMAPEQVVSDPADPRTDVYGLGVVLYRMFTGRLPFTGNDDLELLGHHLASDPDPPALGSAYPGPWLEAVILKTLRKRPENRYPSMDLLAEDLAKLAAPLRPGAYLNAVRPIELPDVYSPKSVFAATASNFLYMKVGKTPPAG